MASLEINAVTALTPASETLIKIELTDLRGDPVIGFSNENIFVGPSVIKTDATGNATVDLVANDQITPENTYYTVTVGNKSFLIDKSGASQTIEEALVFDPLQIVLPGFNPLLAENNLSDLVSPSAARGNLGLGDSATKDVGTVAGTVAAGDDPRFVSNTDHNSLTGRSNAGAHPASAVSFMPYLAVTATDVQNALQQVYNEAVMSLDDAVEINFAPSGTISSTNVQTAIQELDSDTVAARAHPAVTTDAHDASAISFVPSGGAVSINVQDALIELQTLGNFIQYDGSYAGAGTDAGRFRVSGDTQPRHIINAGGLLEWGAGNVVVDTNLYRDSPHVLKTDDSLAVAGGNVTPTATSGSVRLVNTASLQWRNAANSGNIIGVAVDANDDTFLNANSTDEVHLALQGVAKVSVSSARVGIKQGSSSTLIISSDVNGTTAQSGIKFGLSLDTNLYRSATNTLTTDGSLIAGVKMAAPYHEAGTNVAQSGLLRLQNDNYITYRNFANTTDIPALKINANNDTILNADVGREIFLQVNGSTIFGVGTGYMRRGANAAATGEVRLQNADRITWRNSANTSDVPVLSMNASDDIVLNGFTGASLRIQSNGADRLVLGGGGSTYADGVFFAFGTTNGSKIANSTTQKMGFWNATPVVQPTAAGTTAGFASVAGGSAVDTNDTFTGGTGATAYTIGDIVRCLKTIGLIAS